MKIIVCSELVDLERTLSVVRGEPDNMLVVTPNFDIGASLIHRKLLVRFFQSYLDLSSIRTQTNLAWEIGTTWHLPYLSHIRLGSESIGSLMQNESVQMFLAALNTSTAFRRLIETENPEEILLFDRFAMPTFGDPMGGPYYDVCHAVIRYIAEQAGLSVRILPVKPSVQSDTLFSAPADFLKSLAIHSLTLEPNKNTIISFAGTYVDWNEQAKLVQMLGKDCKIFLVQGEPFPMDAPEAVLLDWNALRAWSQDSVTLQIDLKEAWEKFQNDAVRYAGPCPEIFANRYLEFQFHALWSRFERGVQQYAAATWLMASLGPSLVIVGNDLRDETQCILQASRDRNIPCLSILHGGIGANYLYRGHELGTHQIGVWGEFDKRALIAEKVENARIHIIGSLRTDLERLFVQKGEQVQHSDSEMDRPLVMLLTSLVGYGMSDTHTDLEKHLATWQTIVQVAHNHPEIDFWIKPHPRYDYFAFYEQLVRDGPPNLIFKRDAGLQSTISQSAVVVAVNTETTGVLDVLAAEKPLILLAPAFSASPFFATPLAECQVIIWVRELGDFETVLLGIIGQIQRKEKIPLNARPFLQRMCSAIGDEAASRAAALANQIMLKNPPARSEKETARLGAVISLSDWIRDTASSPSRPLSSLDPLDGDVRQKESLGTQPRVSPPPDIPVGLLVSHQLSAFLDRYIRLVSQAGSCAEITRMIVENLSIHLAKDKPSVRWLVARAHIFDADATFRFPGKGAKSWKTHIVSAFSLSPTTVLRDRNARSLLVLTLLGSPLYSVLATLRRVVRERGKAL